MAIRRGFDGVGIAILAADARAAVTRARAGAGEAS
jgi:hypothetical protein